MKKIIMHFRTLLNQVHYNIIYREVSGIFNYCFNPFQTEMNIKMAMEGMSISHKNLIDILVLNLDFTKEEFFGVFNDDEILEQLCDINIIERKAPNNFRFRYVLIAYLDLFIFVSIPYFYNNGSCSSQDIYIGQDTYRLSAIIPKTGIKNCLELCSGSGIQSIIASYTATKVVAIDLNENAVKIGQINMWLNARNNIEFKQGNLFVPVNNEKYDLIICNPPFIPVAKGMNYYPICGAGGEDGLDIIRRILKNLNDHLSTQGKLLMIGEALKSINKILIVDAVYELLPTGYLGTLFIHTSNDIKNHVENFVKFNETVFADEVSTNLRNELNELFYKLKVTEYFSFTLELIKTGNKNITEVQVVKLCNEISDNLEFDNMAKQVNCDYKENEATYQLMQGINVIATIDKDAYKLLKNSISFKVADILNSDVKYQDPALRQSFLDTCAQLEKAKIIKRR